MQISTRVLIAIFSRYSKSVSVSRAELARSLDVAPQELEGALAELERAALVDAARLRLTLSGLAVAVACRAPSRAQRRQSSERRRLARHDLAA
jgi:Mn-dependent DtxR family transcriptional regulator